MPRSRRSSQLNQPLQFHQLTRAPHPDTRFVWGVLAVTATVGLAGLVLSMARAMLM